MQCSSCQMNLEEKISFRSFCPNCMQDLHSCVSCQFYLPGKPNDCRAGNTEPVRDKEKNNFCEEFVYTETPFSEKHKNKAAIAQKLFKEINPIADKNKEEKIKNQMQSTAKKFNDLFKD